MLLLEGVGGWRCLGEIFWCGAGGACGCEEKRRRESALIGRATSHC